MIEDDIRDKEVYKYYNTHLWQYGNELPICLKCGKCPIGLGFWGDDNWRKTHTGYKNPCVAYIANKLIRPKESITRLLREDGGCGVCPNCGSSMMRTKFIFFGKKKCIHPECGYVVK